MDFYQYQYKLTVKESRIGSRKVFSYTLGLFNSVPDATCYLNDFYICHPKFYPKEVKIKLVKKDVGIK